MRLIGFILSALLVLPANGQAPAQGSPMRQRSTFALMQEVRDLLDRAFELRPRRRDTPLRELNITDNEIREIQTIAARHAMSTMLNISPVVAGCPCEEGPLCTDQVYVVSERPEAAVGLQLSRVRNAWVVGPIQAWWLRYEVLQQHQREMDFDEFLGKQRLLLLEFPRCVAKDDSHTP